MTFQPSPLTLRVSFSLNRFCLSFPPPVISSNFHYRWLISSPLCRSSFSCNTSLDPVLDRDVSNSVLPPTLNPTLSEEDEVGQQEQQEREHQQLEIEDSRSLTLRSVSTTKRRKRRRRGKGMILLWTTFRGPSCSHRHPRRFPVSSAARYALPPLLFNQSPIYRRPQGTFRFSRSKVSANKVGNSSPPGPG